MKILKSTYEKYIDRREELIKLIDDANYRKNIAANEGDLSENADYQKAFTDIELYTDELVDVIEVIETGEPVEEITMFNEIVVGSKFNIEVELLAKPLDKGESKDLGVFGVKDVEGSNSTILRGVVTIGGPSDNYAYDGVISTESSVGKFLMGKPLGSYTLNNSFGETLKVVASKC